MNLRRTKFVRAIRYPIEGAIFYFIYYLVRFINIEICSALVGFLAKKIGPLTGAHRTGQKNLKAAFPDLSNAEIENILSRVWENFGRTIGEYPQLKNIQIYQDRRFEIIGAKYIDQLRNDGKAGIIFSGHLANWEVAIMAASQRGLELAQVYRAANNPYVDRLLEAIQGERGNQVIRKGKTGARQILQVLERQHHLFLLNDQKFNQGLAIPFLGYPAMTATAAARMALKFDCPLVPVQVERLQGFSFRITFYKPLEIQKTGVFREDVKLLTSQVCASIEKWVKQRPDQWLWIHKRWPEEFWEKKIKKS